jgi:acyl-CoA synthetase (NDP forming)
MSLAQALFAPRSVALVGASGDETKNTARPQRYMKKHGFTGQVFPVNPGRSEIQNVKAYKTVSDIPVPVDHAYIMVEDVEGAIEDCGRKGVRVATVFADGFADAGEAGRVRQEKLVARAKVLGVRLIGPNSMGMINLHAGATLSVNAILEMDAPPRGGTSLVSQSGTILGAMLSRGAARGLGFAKLVSVGNEADVGVGELVQMLAADPETRTLLLFLEAVRDAEELAKGARAAHAAGKPVVAYKLGRSKLGERLARSHTGALAGEDAALDAFFRDCGIVRVDLLETLIEIGPFLAGQKPPNLSRTPRVSALTNTGGGAAVVVDRLGSFGIETVAPGTDAPIIDLTMGKKSLGYAGQLKELLAWEGNDAVLSIVGSSAQFHAQQVVAPIVDTPRGGKPLAVFLTPHAEQSMALLAGAGIAAFRTPEACADAFRAFFAWKSPAEKGGAERIKWPDAVPSSGKLDEQQGLRLFAALGVPVVESAVVQAPHYRHPLGYPVALKILSAEVAHKTDVGGVALGILNEKIFMEKAVKLGSPLLVQRMETGLAEAIVGYREDPIVGPIVMVGAGGTLAELYNDVALRLAPVDEAGAREMIGQVKGFAVLRGYRGLPPGDLAALAKAVAAMSRLALLPGRPVREAEANPVIVKAAGVVAVDALVVLQEGNEAR